LYLLVILYGKGYVVRNVWKGDVVRNVWKGDVVRNVWNGDVAEMCGREM
jgi:hypothetical protein